MERGFQTFPWLERALPDTLARQRPRLTPSASVLLALLSNKAPWNWRGAWDQAFPSEICMEIWRGCRRVSLNRDATVLALSSFLGCGTSPGGRSPNSHPGLWGGPKMPEQSTGRKESGPLKTPQSCHISSEFPTRDLMWEGNKYLLCLGQWYFRFFCYIQLNLILDNSLG